MAKKFIPYATDITVAAGILGLGAIMVAGAGAYLLAESISTSRATFVISNADHKWTKTTATGLLGLMDTINDGADKIIETLNKN
jgi:hypothetical protein